MNQPPISASGFADLLPAPPTVLLAWSAFTLHVSEPPLHVTAALADHLLASQISGRCRLRQEVSGRSPSSRTSRTAFALNSSVKLRRDRFRFVSGIVDIVSAFRKVSTKPDQAQTLPEECKRCRPPTAINPST